MLIDPVPSHLYVALAEVGRLGAIGANQTSVVGADRALRHGPGRKEWRNGGLPPPTTAKGPQMIWRELLNLFTGREAADATSSWAPYEPVTISPDEAVRAVLVQTGLCHGRDEDVAFVKAAIGGTAFAKGIDLRRHGTQLDKPTLKAMKVRPTAMLTAEYLAILTPAGLADPIEAAQLLTTAYLGQMAGTNALSRAAHAGIEFVEVIPNTMAAGPCSACRKIAEKPVPVAEAPIGPLPDCPHPTQCNLSFRSILAFS